MQQLRADFAPLLLGERLLKGFWFTLVWGRRLNHYLQFLYMVKIQVVLVGGPPGLAQQRQSWLPQPRTCVGPPLTWHWQQGEGLPRPSQNPPICHMTVGLATA